MKQYGIGLVGLGPMGAGLAANLLANGFDVAGWDRDITGASPDVMAEVTPDVKVCASLEDLVASVAQPRRILLSIPGGAPVDQVLTQLMPLLSAGDVVADCGNSHFKDTARRARMMRDEGVGYLGVGVSGGPDGARKGPAIMAGGDKAAWQSLRPAFEAIAAKIDGDACCGYLGADGAGHFVKMVHNGIEYAVMHLLMEAYETLKRSYDADAEQLAEVFSAMNKGLSGGYLTAVTARVVAERMPGENAFLIDVVADTVGHKGTGQWTVATAFEQGVAVPTLAEAVMYRLLSATLAGKPVPSVRTGAAFERNPDAPAQMSDALACAFISAFAQGLTIFGSCQSSLGHSLDQTEILRIWRGGCILQGPMVEFLRQCAVEHAAAENVLNWAPVRATVDQTQKALRSVVAAGILAGIPSAGLASALAYVDALGGAPLPSALLQLQRDFFGRHGLRDKRTGEAIAVAWNKGADQT